MSDDSTHPEHGDVWSLHDDGRIRDENGLLVLGSEIIERVRELQDHVAEAHAALEALQACHDSTLTEQLEGEDGYVDAGEVEALGTLLERIQRLVTP